VSPALRLPLLLGGLLGALPAPALDHPEPGAAVASADLAVVGGEGRLPLVVPGKVTVLAFVRPGQAHSAETLAHLATLSRELSPDRVAFAAVVSDRSPAAEVEALLGGAGARMPALADPGDELYGSLGVRLHPTVAVVDARGRLAAWEPFRKVNELEVLRARVREALGELSRTQAELSLAPARAAMPGDDRGAVARRDLNLGRMLLDRRSYGPALQAARRALALEEGAMAHALAGRALAGLGRCAEALAELDRALELEPGDARAREAREGCTR